jgi:hypothetical protein
VLTPAVITALRRRAASGTPLDFGKDLWPLIAREVETADLEHWYTPLNAFLSIGPPPRRVEEMIALIEAGSLEALGPACKCRPTPVRPDSWSPPRWCRIGEFADRGHVIPVDVLDVDLDIQGFSSSFPGTIQGRSGDAWRGS